MDLAIAAEIEAVPTAAKSVRKSGGPLRQSLLAGDAPDGLNFRFYRSLYQSGADSFTSPRHHHAFQQIRWTESGAVNFAPGQYIDEGDVAYFPRGAYYGPQLKDQGVGILLQFGFSGEHQSGAVWERYREEALESLNARGVFENGLYIETDPVTGKRSQKDAVQALYEAQYERHTNRKFVIPPEGYDAPILMHPAAFEYYEAEPGVELKHLGGFYEHPGPNGDVRIGMVRLSAGGVYRLGADRAQLIWTKSPGLQVDGRAYPELTCLFSGRDEAVSISAAEPLELNLVEFPRLD